jgi:hypothetical protein
MAPMMTRPGGNLSRRDRMLIAGRWILFIVFANLFAGWFVSREQYLYFWDYAEYWHDTILMVEMLRNAPLRAISQLLHSMRHYDYNYLPTLPLAMPMLVLGETRLVYVLSIVNIFAIPAALGLTAASKSIARNAGCLQTPTLSFLAPLTIFAFPPFWIPTLRGYPDIGGVAIVSGILVLYFRKQPQVLKTEEMVLSGVLLAILVLFRRWYGFWAVSFILLSAVDAGFALWNEESLDFEACWKTYRPTIFVVVSFVIALAGIAWPLVVHMITTPYRNIYSAYRGSSNIAGALHGVARGYLGSFFCGAFLFSAIVLAAVRHTRRVCLLLLGQTILIVILFTHIQDFGSQHIYLLLPTIIIFISLALLELVNMSNWIIVPVYLWFSSMAFVPVFWIYNGPLSLTCQYISSLGRCFPLVRHDLPEIRRLLAVLQDYNARAAGGVYVLASSYVINSSVIREANHSMGTNYEVTGKILRTADVDKRDGFPSPLLDARYVLVADPIQYHLRPEDQRVVSLPAEALLMHRNIGNAFDRLPESFVLDDNVKVYLFSKARPITKVELSELEEECERVYPHNSYICVPAKGW